MRATFASSFILPFFSFSLFQRPQSKQQLGPAVRVHVPRPGDDERETGTDESLDFDQETDRRVNNACTREASIIFIVNFF